MQHVKPYPGMIIRESVELEPGVYYFPTGNGIRIEASEITIRGDATYLIGPGQAGDLESYDGIAISAHHQHHVRLEGLVIHGFKVAAQVSDGHHWDIVSNDFSYNYTDEEYGWGEGFPYGAVVLIRVEHSRVIGNTATGNWNGLSLRESNSNEIKNNVFSHCSNVCLKLWNSRQNRIEDNDFSHGLRIRPGETHARDSTCALLESGSSDNVLLRNNFTHGGDGVFIRPLNGWHSEGNYFESNDASFAHNNAWECWSPNNVFVRNKGNFSSYGFWMGGSDGTVMIANEAAYNGLLHHNAPEPDFGNAGVAVVHGSSTHFRFEDNVVYHNHGAGLALGYRSEYKATHWVIRGNRLGHNRVGLFIRDADGIYLRSNHIAENLEGDVSEGPNVSNITWLPCDDSIPVRLLDERIQSGLQVYVTGSLQTIGPRSYVIARGENFTAKLDLSGAWNLASTRVEWVDSEAGTVTERTYIGAFAQVGFRRLCAVAYDGANLGLEWVNVYVVDPGAPEIGTDGPIEDWSLLPYEQDSNGNSPRMCATLDDNIHILGRCAVKLTITNRPCRIRTCCRDVWSDIKTLRFFIRIRCHTVFGLRGARQRIRIGQSDDDYVEYSTGGHLFEGLMFNEAWEDWNYVEVPLSGDAHWARSVSGLGCVSDIRYIEFLHEGTDDEPGVVEIWLDGMQLIEA